MTATLTSIADGRALVQPALQAAVDQLDPTSRAMARYHFGWTDAGGRPASGDGGKAVRPTLALLSAQAAGAPAEVGVPGAVAVELVHNFSLVHDDLMDGDTRRRHRETVWSLWGSSGAILLGDALLALAVQVLLEAGTAEAAQATRSLVRATQALVRGQLDDLAFERRPVVGLQECLAMAAGKTGALLSVSAGIGAELAGAPLTTVTALSRFGAELGLAFQLVDDLLGIWGDPSVTGKPVLADLRCRKKSLPVTFSATSGTPAGEELASWLAGPGEPAEDELPHVARLVEAGGGRSWTREEAGRRTQAAEQALSEVDLPAQVAGELTRLGRHIRGRES